MPFNFFTFILSEKFANEEFERRNVPNPESARRTALVASFLAPAGGGSINAAVLPAVIAREAARREAEAAAAQQTNGSQPSGQPSLVPYTSFFKQPVKVAHPELSKNFNVTITDEKGTTLNPAQSQEHRVVSQSPDPATTTALAPGSAVTLVVTTP